MTTKELLDKVISTEKKFHSELENIVYDLVDDIVELNTEYQMFKGLDNTGNVVGEYARNYKGSGKGYPKIKGNKYNLFIDGDLFRSVDYIFKKYTIEMFSDRPDHPFLKYNPEIASQIVGLVESNQLKLNYELVKPRLVQWLIKSI